MFPKRYIFVLFFLQTPAWLLFVSSQNQITVPSTDFLFAQYTKITIIYMFSFFVCLLLTY